jgi:hypothetical protein
VDDVIRESISEYLDRSTFNNIRDIAALLEKLGFAPAEHNEEFPRIQEMIRRRHLIVHRGDRAPARELEKCEVQPITSTQVRGWMDATVNFMGTLLGSVFIKQNTAAALEARFNIKMKSK